MLWWFVNELYDEFAESSLSDNGSSFAVPKSAVDELVFKYFGAEAYTPALLGDYDKGKDCFVLPTAGGGSWIDVHFLEFYSVSENIITYKCVFNLGPNDDGFPTPYSGIYASFYAMKDDGEPYLRLLSFSGPDEKFDTVEEALDSLN